MKMNIREEGHNLLVESNCLMYGRCLIIEALHAGTCTIVHLNCLPNLLLIGTS